MSEPTIKMAYDPYATIEIGDASNIEDLVKQTDVVITATFKPNPSFPTCQSCDVSDETVMAAGITDRTDGEYTLYICQECCAKLIDGEPITVKMNQAATPANKSDIILVNAEQDKQ